MKKTLSPILIGLCLALFPGVAGAVDRPNIILIMTDDQGYGDLSCHGNPDVQTPHLDRLYRESVRFTDFHVDPTCAPTRAALMTGRYSLSTGVWHTIAGRSFLHPDEVTVANVLKGEGYATGIFGKWHLGDNFPCRPHDRGFDQAIYHGGGGIGQTPDLWGNDYFGDRYFHNGKPRPFKGYCTDVWFDEAMQFMGGQREEPFFCCLLPNAPHGPYFVDKKYSQPFAEKGFSQNRANFYGMLVNIDENIGRLESFLKQQGLRDNTLVIFMTDNGTAGPWYPKEGNDHTAGLRGIKGSIYEGGHRVPFFARWPEGKIGGGRDVSHPAGHIDVLPTLMDLSGAKRPGDQPIHGRSLAPLLRNPDAEWKKRTLIVNNQRIATPKKYKDFVVISDQWRLVGKDELYDLGSDRGQQNNLAAGNPDVVRELLQAYEAWWDQVSGRVTTLVPITVGDDKENPAFLTAHDWHASPKTIPWHQDVVKEAPAFSGYWEILVAETGTYRIALMERPSEAAHPMTGASAVLEVGGETLKKPIPSGATTIEFVVELKAGPTQLKSTLRDSSGATRGAYYARVFRQVTK
ncbi:MAG: arylsulfatase [Verrucomicrobiota bacterium]